MSQGNTGEISLLRRFGKQPILLDDRIKAGL